MEETISQNNPFPHFNFHVNSEKNDFSSWIYDVIGDIKLAEDIRDVKDAKTAGKIVRNRISNLKG